MTASTIEDAVIKEPNIEVLRTDQAVSHIQLRMSAWQSAKRSSAQDSRADGALTTEPVSSPKLQPEIWLHSKEP